MFVILRRIRASTRKNQLAIEIGANTIKSCQQHIMTPDYISVIWTRIAELLYHILSFYAVTNLRKAVCNKLSIDAINEFSYQLNCF